MNISRMKKYSGKHFKEFCAAFPQFSGLWGSEIPVMKKEIRWSPLDVDIPPSLSAVCELMNPIKVNRVKDSDWGWLFCHDQCFCLQRPQRHLSAHTQCSPHFTHHFAISHSSYLIFLCVSLSFSCCSLSLSQQPPPHLSFCPSTSTLHYLQCGNA